MFDDLLRRLKDRLLAPIARLLGSHVAPNTVSVIAFVVGLAAAFAAARSFVGWSVGLWLANRVLDGFDGTQARVHELQSDFGGYLDILLDFIVYAAIPLGLIVVDSRLAFAGAVLQATFFVNAASWMYLAAILERRHAGAAMTGELTTVTMPAGVVAGTETIVLYTLMLSWPAARETLFWAMAALVGVNVVQRLWWARHHL
jgi:phosphatidylglycerophosphate synthase